MFPIFSSKSSCPQTQANDALQRSLIEFLVFKSAFVKWKSLYNACLIMIIIYNSAITEKLPREHPQIFRNTIEYY